MKTLYEEVSGGFPLDSRLFFPNESVFARLYKFVCLSKVSVCLTKNLVLEAFRILYVFSNIIFVKYND